MANQSSKKTQTTVSGSTGQVSQETAQGLANAQADYNPSASVNAAYEALQGTLANKPGAFQGSYQQQLGNIYNQIMNREQFKYDQNADSLYQQYRQSYQQNAQNAMQNTVGMANALSGGYANSYSQTVGQQGYNQYMQQMDNIIPTLYEIAYQKYADEGQQMMANASLTRDLDRMEYGQYRDTVSDWQTDRAYATNAYQNERAFDRGVYEDTRDYWTNRYWNERDAEKTTTKNWQEESSSASSKSQTNQPNVSKQGRTAMTKGKSGENLLMWYQNMKDPAQAIADDVAAGRITTDDGLYLYQQIFPNGEEKWHFDKIREFGRDTNGYDANGYNTNGYYINPLKERYSYFDEAIDPFAEQSYPSMVQNVSKTSSKKAASTPTTYNGPGVGDYRAFAEMMYPNQSASQAALDFQKLQEENRKKLRGR